MAAKIRCRYTDSTYNDLDSNTRFCVVQLSNIKRMLAKESEARKSGHVRLSFLDATDVAGQMTPPVHQTDGFLVARLGPAQTRTRLAVPQHGRQGEQTGESHLDCRVGGEPELVLITCTRSVVRARQWSSSVPPGAVRPGSWPGQGRLSRWAR